jgi:hypothetical protein
MTNLFSNGQTQSSRTFVMDQVDKALKAQGYNVQTIGESYYKLLQNVTNRYLLSGGSFSATSEEHESIAFTSERPVIMANQTAQQVGVDQFAELISQQTGASELVVLGALGSLAARYGATSLIIPAAAAAAPFLLPIAAAGVALEVVDLATPGIDLPSPSDIPQALMAALTGKGFFLTDAAGQLLGDLDDLLMTGSRANGSRPSMNGAVPHGNPFQLGQTWDANRIVRVWEANDVWYAKQSNGRALVQRKDGTIKEFSYPKPIVLNRKGANSPKQLLQVDAWVDKQMAALDKAMKKRGYGRKPRASSVKRTVITDGVTQIKN